jgi:hypothetical protein
MKRYFLFLFFSFFLSLSLIAGEIKEQLALLKDVGGIEELTSEHYTEKYLVRITQPVDHKRPEAGTFTQRVVVCHVGLDRPTIVVTEGYGGNYALSPRYQDELSRLLEANVIVAEHRYFLESTPEPLNWDYLTAENSAFDLHHIVTTFQTLYAGQWVSTGISKGGQTSMIYRAFFPDDVNFSVPYVAPLCRGVEDGRHEGFLRKVGTKAERRKIEDFQLEILKRKATLIPKLETFCREKQLTFRIPIAEVLDYCVLEYSFAFWQWGTPVSAIPSLESEDELLFKHLIDISGPDYFAENQPNGSFFVQAARELGYYGYDVRPFRKYLTIKSAQGYLAKLMLPSSTGTIDFKPALYEKIYHFLRDEDPRMIYIYGESDPWSAAHVPIFKKKQNSHYFFQPRGNHRTRISNMPEKMKEQIVKQMDEWLNKSSHLNE